MILQLCTSGFLDDVMFSLNGTSSPESKTVLCFVQFARWQHKLDFSPRYVWSSFFTR